MTNDIYERDDSYFASCEGDVRAFFLNAQSLAHFPFNLELLFKYGISVYQPA